MIKFLMESRRSKSLLGAFILIGLGVLFMVLLCRAITIPTVHMSWSEQKCLYVENLGARERGEHYTCDNLPPKYRQAWRQ